MVQTDDLSTVLPKTLVRQITAEREPHQHMHKLLMLNDHELNVVMQEHSPEFQQSLRRGQHIFADTSSTNQSTWLNGEELQALRSTVRRASLIQKVNDDHQRDRQTAGTYGRKEKAASEHFSTAGPHHTSTPLVPKGAVQGPSILANNLRAGAKAEGRQRATSKVTFAASVVDNTQASSKLFGNQSTRRASVSAADKLMRSKDCMKEGTKENLCPAPVSEIKHKETEDTVPFPDWTAEDVCSQQ